MPTPTVVIGVGQAGCRMLSRAHQVIGSEGSTDQYLFIAIDSNKEDLSNEAPDTGNIREIALHKPKSHWISHQSAYFYLDEDYDIERQDGTGQSRPVSRYHIDSNENLDRLKQRLRDAITGFVEDRQLTGSQKGSDFNIWIVNSLGGGTGSGAFPLVTGIVHSITSSMRETATVNGIGSLPRLSRDDNQELYQPPGPNKLYANAYAALAELRALVGDYGGSDWTPPEIELLEDDQVLQPTSDLSDEIEFFHKYWLIGFDESEGSSSGYRRRMNQIAADMIQYYSDKDEIEDFPYADHYLKEETLAAISSGRLYVPIEELREVITLRESIDALENDFETLGAEIAAYSNTRDFYDEVLDIQLRVDGIPDNLERVDRGFLQNCLEANTEVDPKAEVQDVSFEDGRPDRAKLREMLDEQIQVKLDSNRQLIWSPDIVSEGETPTVDSEDIVAYFYCDILRAYLDEVLEEHRFVEKVEELWSGRFSDDIEKYASLNYEQLEDSDPDVKWEGALEDFIPDRGETLVNRRDNTLQPIRRYKLSKQVKALRQYNSTLPDLYEQYKKIKVYRNVVDQRFKSARDELRNRRKEVQELTDEKQEEKEEVFDDHEGLQKDLERLRESLNAPIDERREHGEFRPPIQNIDALSRSDVYSVIDVGELLDANLLEEDELELTLDQNDFHTEDLEDIQLSRQRLEDLGLLEGVEVPESAVVERPSIATLADSGFIDKGALVTELSDLIAGKTLSSNPVEDIEIEPPVNLDTEKFLGVIANRDNVHEDGPLGDLLALEVGNRPSPQEEMGNQEFNFIGEPVASSDRFSIRLLSWFMPIALENTSEFGKMNRHFLDQDSDIEESLNIDNLSDEFVERSFAYPEAIEGTEVEDRFSELSDRGR